jgi:hypothetical protein
MIRGIGDPLVAAYAHCYLCRVGMAVTTGDREYIKENFYDFLASYNQVIYSKFLCTVHSMTSALPLPKKLVLNLLLSQCLLNSVGNLRDL